MAPFSATYMPASAPASVRGLSAQGLQASYTVVPVSLLLSLPLARRLPSRLLFLALVQKHLASGGHTEGQSLTKSSGTSTFDASPFSAARCWPCRHAIVAGSHSYD